MELTPGPGPFPGGKRGARILPAGGVGWGGVVVPEGSPPSSSHAALNTHQPTPALRQWVLMGREMGNPLQDQTGLPKLTSPPSQVLGSGKTRWGLGALVYLSEKWVDNSPTWMLAQASGQQACEWEGSSGGHGRQAGAGSAAWILGEGQAQPLGSKCFSVPEALGYTSRGAWDDWITLCDEHGQAEWSAGQLMAAGPMAFMPPRSERFVQSQEEEWVW